MDFAHEILLGETSLECDVVPQLKNDFETYQRDVYFINPTLRNMISILGIHPLDMGELETHKKIADQPPSILAMIKKEDEHVAFTPTYFTTAMVDNEIVLKECADKSTEIFQNHRKIVLVINKLEDVAELLKQVPLEVVKYNTKLLSAL